MSKLVALAGLPNSGKTSIFNILTGSKQKVANYPGVTVERKKGVIELDNAQIEIIDTPGVYSLDSTTLDEKVSKDILLHKNELDRPDLVVMVIDSSNYKKALYLALQLKEIGTNLILCLNMQDIAESRGQKLNLNEIARAFECPAIETSISDSESINQLKKLIFETLNQIGNGSINLPKKYQSQMKSTEYIKDKLMSMDELAGKITINAIKPDTVSAKLDQFLLHPVWGVVALLATLILMFQLLFAWSDPLVGIIENAFEWLTLFADSNLTNGLLKSFITDGLIAGIGGVVVFLPHILIMFFFILLLEDCGYLTRAVFLLDSLMRRLGLPGKAVIPLLSSHACAIPGIMSARIIENERDRLATILVSPLTTCSARLPVYTLLIAAIVPATKTLGFFDLRGLVMFALYFMGMASAFIISAILKRTTLNGPPTMLLMEMPSYKKPRASDLARGLWSRTKMFCKKVATIITILSILIWVLVSFPRIDQQTPDIQNSYAAKIGKTFEPIFRPIGFDWRITTSLIPSFGAREVVVSALSSVLSVEASEEDLEFELGKIISSEFTLASLLSLLVWFIYAPQCISTFAVMRKETNSFVWPSFMMAYTLILAYLMSFMTYWVTGLILA